MASNDLNHVSDSPGTGRGFCGQHQNIRVMRIRFHGATGNKPALIGISSCGQTNLSSEIAGGK